MVNLLHQTQSMSILCTVTPCADCVGVCRGVLGDRSFSKPWGGSVLDSIIGTFLTQNVADQLSSQAYMTLAATFPAKPYSTKPYGVNTYHAVPSNPGHTWPAAPGSHSLEPEPTARPEHKTGRGSSSVSNSLEGVNAGPPLDELSASSNAVEGVRDIDNRSVVDWDAVRVAPVAQVKFV